MAFSFIHTADWQLGKTFGGFPTELAAQLRAARLNAIDKIAEHAHACGAHDVLVAGDVFEHETPDPKTVRHAVERLALSKTITWWLLPGNHDAARPNGLWTRLTNDASLSIPDNVRLLLKPEPVKVRDDIVLLPAPLTSRHPGQDVTDWMASYEEDTGVIRIGIAHGSVHGFGSEDEVAAHIAKDRAQSAKLDYLALGDWHGKKQINDRTWYSGTPEPDRFPRNNDPGWCLSVTIDRPGAAPDVQPLATAEFLWCATNIQVSVGTTAGDIFDQALASVQTAQKTLLKLSLSGTIDAEAVADLRDELAKHKHALAFLDVRQDDLRVALNADTLDHLDHGGSLRVAGENLAARAQDAQLTAEQRQDAQNALSLLLTFAREADRESAL